MEPLLFSVADFAPYCELPELDEGRLEPHMRRAQRRLRPLLGEPLYTELVRLHTATELTGDFEELHKKAIPALVHESLAQYWPFSQTTVTRAGLRQKESVHSTPIDARTLAQQVQIYHNEALSYEMEMQAWLRLHAVSLTSFYPQTACGASPGQVRTPMVVVQAIGRPA